MGKWHVITTRKGWEKKAEQLLLAKGFNSYCPLRKVQRKWSDRMKTITAPLFHTYMFVKVTEDQRPAVRLTPGVKNFVHANGRPATVTKRELDALRQMLDGGNPVEVLPVTKATLETALRNSNAKVRKTRIALGENGYEVRIIIGKPKVTAVLPENALQ